MARGRRLRKSVGGELEMNKENGTASDDANLVPNVVVSDEVIFVPNVVVLDEAIFFAKCCCVRRRRCQTTCCCNYQTKHDCNK